MKKPRIALCALAVLLVLAGGLFILYRTTAARPPALYVNGVRIVGAGFSWRTPLKSMEADSLHPVDIAYGEEHKIVASMGDALKLRNKLPWLGARQRAQVTLYEMDSKNCYASWPLASRPALEEGYADPGSYYMEIMVEYRSLFASGTAHYGVILIIE